MSQNAFNIPLFLISFNRLTYLRSLITWLETKGYRNIQIVDNASTYPPLLEYLRSSPHRVHRLDSNMGHLAVWTCGRFDEELNSGYYVVSDCDILPIAECPASFLSVFREVLEKYSQYTKVGFSLKIDDLPDCYFFKEEVTDWEAQFWQKTVAPGLFTAPIDTTFALYRPGIFPSCEKWWSSIRMAEPYTARHLPWYENSAELTEEEIYYQKNVEVLSTHWSVTDALCIKEQNKIYRREIARLRKELETIRSRHILVDRNPYVFLKRCVRGSVSAVYRSLASEPSPRHTKKSAI